MLAVGILIDSFPGRCQTQGPYVLLGQGHAESCSCYLLADGHQPDTTTVWNQQTLDLSQSFDFQFRIRVGCSGSAPDGFSFMLASADSPMVKRGNRMGFAGIPQTLAIALDTRQDPEDLDPAQEHMELQWNGNTRHGTPENIRGPAPISSSESAIADCQWHIFRIYWDAVDKRMEVGLDHPVLFKLDTDLVKAFFHGNPLVHWGFGGSAPGNADSLEFCATLFPSVSLNPALDSLICQGTAVQIVNNSWSFWKEPQCLWEWGDGSSSLASAPAAHTYPSPGHYTVHLILTGPDGCTDTTLHQGIQVLLPPKAAFSSGPACEGQPLPVKDLSTAILPDTLTQWNWSWPGGNSQNSAVQIVPSAQGPFAVTLQVKGKASCWSEPSTLLVNVRPEPKISLLVLHPCLGSLTTLSAQQTSRLSMLSWFWNFPLDTSAAQQGMIVEHRFARAGQQPVLLTAAAADGCSQQDSFSIQIQDVHIQANGDSLAVRGQPFHLDASGAATYAWSPSTGLDNPWSPQPEGVLFKDVVYTVLGTTSQGCEGSDSIHVHVFDHAGFWVPNAFTPNADGINDYFRPWNPGIERILMFNVFDRWGRLLYHSTHIGLGWDGTYRGQPLPIGTYGWEIRGLDFKGAVYQASGSVVLIR